MHHEHLLSHLRANLLPFMFLASGRKPESSEETHVAMLPWSHELCLDLRGLKIALTRRGMGSTRSLKVCCGIWYQDVSSRSFKSAKGLWRPNHYPH
ncbi:hypothetical protein QTP70_013675 [Hemibagrus guttatus]|uniref:Uncharacterized protein n=1 Tax=Hemibagrus guttatus TaxID=175788 RepID=A0AAE0V0E0_9TELE|nr:hypothetical protein QTP70_013675 [Hemibagrus guttatus]